MPRRAPRLAAGLSVLFLGTALSLVPLLDAMQLGILIAVLPALILAAHRDLVTGEIPDIVPIWLALVGCISLLHPTASPLAHGITALAAGTLLWGASELWYRRYGSEALGLGDIKMISAAALILGPFGLWLLMLLAPIGGIIYIFIRRDPASGVPFAPFLSYGIILSYGGTIWLVGR